MTSAADSNPRIYVACLAAYNNGYLHGVWIDADQDADEIRKEISAMLARSPITGAEEYAIHDYEGFEGVTIREYASIESVARMGAFIAEYGALGAGLLKQFVGDIDQAEAALQDCYHGQHASLADYMEELTAESVTIPDALRYYINWEAMARDAEMNGEFFTVETARNEVHVFSNY
ncbi:MULTISPECIES: antirestriction protein ArdA [unclassified Chelatococcus]|uniref:antirestriction protein ArdA n=1 Tax=unclassified Chelatococcus TaxID=2638111 RepID=UPI001BD0FE1B|nr:MULTISPECIES: antirestriction protein ArdA [unclassified Chelatococcus]MBS7697474.1 antirestriction protein ArdA [Chelatococcus sp. YT9]MBX3560109.1 antirestriction protein ArdA [Chelatococcus sp.]